MTKMPRCRLTLLGGLLAALTSGHGNAIQVNETLQETGQETPAVFRVRSNLVLIDFIAEKDRAFLPDLRLEDVEVYEDGKKQVIQHFELIDLNMANGAGPEPGQPPIPESARLALVADLASLDIDSRQFIKLHAGTFLENSLVPGDEVMVAGMGRTGLRVYTPFTTDVDKVLAGLERALLSPDGWLEGEKRDAGFNALPTDQPVPTVDLDGIQDASLQAQARSQRQVEVEIQRQESRNARESLLLLARYLQPLPGRKNVVLFSEGYRSDLREFALADPTDPRRQNASDPYDDFRSPTRAANRAQISYYTIDPRGMAVNRSQFGSQEFHNLIARETGGLGPSWSNDLNKQLQRAYDESRRYYRVAYAPHRTPDPGKIHRIRVKVARKGVKVRGRDEYVEPNRAAAEKYDPAAALAFPSLFHEFDFEMKTSQKEGRFQVQSRVATDQVLFREEASERVAEMSFFALVTNLKGESMTKVKLPLSKTYTLRFDEEQLASLTVLAAEHPLEVELKSGEYLLTFAIYQPWAQRVSASSTTIVVP